MIEKSKHRQLLDENIIGLTGIGRQLSMQVNTSDQYLHNHPQLKEHLLAVIST